jgi:hypothetical protein
MIVESLVAAAMRPVGGLDDVLVAGCVQLANTKPPMAKSTRLEKKLVILAIGSKK